MQRRNRGQQKRNNRPRRNGRRNRRGIKDAVVRLPRNMLIMPDRIRTHLRLFISKVFNLSVSTQGAFRFRPTGAQQIDPLGALSFPGWTDLSGIYSSYRVHSSTFRIETCNPSNSQLVHICIVPLNADPGATPSLVFVEAAASQPFAKWTSAALLGGPCAILSSAMSTEKMYGNRGVTLSDDNFGALVSAIPVNNWYWMVCAFTQGVIAANFTVNCYICVEIEFYDRFQLPN